MPVTSKLTSSCTEHTGGTSFSLENSLKSKRPVGVREASFEDYPQIAALESKYGLETKPYEQWTHLWSDNPAYRSNRDNLPIGWVLEGENKEILGYLGNVPLNYEFEGRTLLATAARAWVVEEHCRGYSLLLSERYFSQKTVDLFLNATVGPLASVAFSVYRSFPVPAGAWDRSAFWITNYQGFSANWLTMKALPLPKPLSYLLSVGLMVKDKLSSSQLHRQSCEDVTVCTEVDDRFDRFWKELRKLNAHLLMGVRTREALEWHFKYALRDNRAWIVTAGKGSSFNAYAVFRRYDNPRFGLQRMRLVDFQTLDGNMACLVPMLAWALGRCRREGIDMLESIGFSGEKWSIVSDCAPYKRKLPSWLYFCKVRDESLARKLSNPTVWDPSQFDGDASL